MKPGPSAGILLYRRPGDGLEVLLAHPGGPYWARQDHGSWSVPKGIAEPDEAPEAVALCSARSVKCEERRGSAEEGLTQPCQRGVSDVSHLLAFVHPWERPPQCDPVAVRQLREAALGSRESVGCPRSCLPGIPE